MNGEKLLILEPEARIAEMAVATLSNAGYLVFAAMTIAEALRKTEEQSPDLLLVNPVSAGGLEGFAGFRRHTLIAPIPLILLADQPFTETNDQEYRPLAEDILIKPFSPKVLLEQVNTIITKHSFLKLLNPLTGLPGRMHLSEAFQGAGSEPLRLIFTDLKGFRGYNQYYGFAKGNEVILFLANMLEEELKKTAPEKSLLFHLGKDRFCIIIEPAPAVSCGRNIIQRFDREISAFYAESDRARGGLAFPDRRGMIKQWPIMTIALGVVGHEQDGVTGHDWLGAETIGIELLKEAKSMPGSSMVAETDN